MSNSYSRNCTRFSVQLGYKLTEKRRHLISQMPLLFKLPLLYGLCLRQCQRVCHRPGAQVLGLRIQMRVDIRRGRNIAVSQPLLNLLHRYPLFQQQAGTGVPLRYNNDKQKKPLFSRGLSVCRLLFNSFSKLKIDENYKEKRRLFY